jgi:hypothetical protein
VGAAPEMEDAVPRPPNGGAGAYLGYRLICPVKFLAFNGERSKHKIIGMGPQDQRP